MAVGCSGGSIYAGMIALGLDPEEAQRFTLNLFTSDVFEGYASKLKSALTGETRFNEMSSLIDDRVMVERLRTVFSDKTFEETLFPLYIVATDLYTGDRVVLSSGKILDAIRAHDSEAARRAMLDHVMATENVIYGLVPEVASKEAAPPSEAHELRA